MNLSASAFLPPVSTMAWKHNRALVHRTQLRAEDATRKTKWNRWKSSKIQEEAVGEQKLNSLVHLVLISWLCPWWILNPSKTEAKSLPKGLARTAWQGKDGGTTNERSILPMPAICGCWLTVLFSKTFSWYLLLHDETKGLRGWDRGRGTRVSTLGAELERVPESPLEPFLQQAHPMPPALEAGPPCSAWGSCSVGQSHPIPAPPALWCGLPGRCPWCLVHCSHPNALLCVQLHLLWQKPQGRHYSAQPFPPYARGPKAAQYLWVGSMGLHLP